MSGRTGPRCTCGFIQRRHRTIVAVASALTLVGGALSSRLTVDSDLAALLPASFPSVQAMADMGEGVVWSSHLRVAIRTRDFAAALALAEEVTRRLESSPLVASVTYRNDVAFYERHALLFLEEARFNALFDAVTDATDLARRRYNPLVVDGLFGDGDGPEEAGLKDQLRGWEEEYRSSLPRPFQTDPSRTVLVVDVVPATGAGDLRHSQSVVEEVRGIVASLDPPGWADDIEIHFGGNVQNRVTEFQTIGRDIVGTAAFGVGGVFLLVALAFRSVTVAVLISVSLVASLSWTFGLTYLLFGRLNTITGFLFLVLFGLGVDHGIHAMARYREARRSGIDPVGATHRMVCMGGRALVTSALTTAAAFFSMAVFEFRGFAELGIITGIGTLFAVLAMLVLLPALVAWAEERGILRWAREGRPEEPRASKPFPFPRTILLGGLALTVASGIALMGIRFQYDLSDLRIMTPERETYARVTAEVFPPVEVPAVVLASTPAEVEEVVEALERIRTEDRASPTIDRVMWVGSLVPLEQERRIEGIRALREVVEEAPPEALSLRDEQRLARLQRSLTVDTPFTWEDFPDRDRARFTAPGGGPGNFVLVYPSVSLRDGRNAMAFRDDVGTFRTESGQVYHAASSNIIVADLLTMVTREGPFALLLSLAVVALIVLVSTRSPLQTVLIITPLAAALLWTGGLMAWGGVQLNFFNLVIFPSLVGIGVDDGVHLVHRFREEGPGSTTFVLSRTGMAVALTTATTMIGYGGLLFAHHPGLQAMGAVAVIGLALTLLSAIVLLPALLDVTSPRREAR